MRRRVGDYFLCPWVLHMFAFLAALPAMAAILFGVMAFQSAYVPVVTDFEVKRFERLGPTRIEIWGEMTKRFEVGDRLPMCRFDSMTWWSAADDIVNEARWWTLERPLGQTVNRQPGRQSFGPWIIDYTTMPDAAEVYGTVDHWCLGFWPTRTKLGPLVLHPKKG